MKVGLVMIVKNEEAVIQRALESVKPFISTYVIVDTGSTDNTKKIISSVMSDVPGLVVDRPWVSFGHNRSEALALCDGRMDWAIMLDADDSVGGTVPPSSVWQTEVDAFMISCIYGTTRHQRTQIFKTGIGWVYEGSVHEYAVCRSKAAAIAVLPPETHMITRCEGSRSKNSRRFITDAQLLEKELLTKPDDHRILFYLAQSYRDAGLVEKAQLYYRNNLDISGGWDQERYMTLVNLILLEKDDAERRRLTWMAINLCPERLEAQYTYLTMHRSAELEPTQEIFAIASFTKGRKMEPSDLFVTPYIYEMGMDDELAIVAFKTGHYREAYEASTRCMIVAPEPLRTVALKNAQAAYQHMQ